MGHNTLASYDNVIPLKQPIDGGTTDFVTPYVQLKGAHRLAFLIQFGVTTQNATTDRINVTVECASVETETEAAVAFTYRKSSAVTANTWGAVTAATTTGAELTYLEEGMSLWIEVDVDTMGTNDYKFARVAVALNAFTAAFVSIVGFVDSRYKMTTMQSVTAAASA